MYIRSIFDSFFYPGDGPVPDRPTRENKHNIVFEAAREVPGRHTDTKLQAVVYNSPRFDKGRKTSSNKYSAVSRTKVMNKAQ